ncbi:MAG: phosphatase PAP2 family protein [Dysgonomonas sp.]
MIKANNKHNKIYIALSVLLCCLLTTPLYSNATDSIKQDSLVLNQNITNLQSEYSKFKPARFILPTAFIAYGFTSRYTGLDEIDKRIQKESQKHFNTNTWADDVLLFVPHAAVFGLDWCGVKPVNNFKDRFIVSATSFAIGEGLTLITKHATNRWRPNGENKESFPSAHTCLAFSGAHILMKEYRHVSPWIGIGGYTVATTVGVLRITNNKHWFSDVVAGAGFGILSVELSYLLLPYLSRTFSFGKEKKEETSLLEISPIMTSEHIGFGFQYRF